MKILFYNWDVIAKIFLPKPIEIVYLDGSQDQYWIMILYTMAKSFITIVKFVMSIYHNQFCIQQELSSNLTRDKEHGEVLIEIL